MDVFFTDKLDLLSDFADQSHRLAIFQREEPDDASMFFQSLMKTTFRVSGKLGKATAVDDIRAILGKDIPSDVQRNPFYEVWLKDMADVSSLFCDVEKDDAISIWIGSKRGCTRYHVDIVPQRLLVTYAGRGTEWLPDEAADWKAYSTGEPNEKIIKDPAARQYIGQWDVAIFRGGQHGLLHRTPDEALNGPSVLMRLDNKTFYS